MQCFNTRQFQWFLLLLSFSLVFAGREKAEDNIKPTITIEYRPDNGIRIDGVLDEAIWNDIEPFTGFSENYPDDNAVPPVRTEVFMTYDDKNLYVAYICYDDQEAVRANMSDRDNIWSDDYMGMMLDTYGTQNWMYFIAANPYGIQGETRISSSSGEDVSFNIIYESDGRVTERGYEIEMAIPFSSLRFPDQQVQEWRVNFWRTHPRESRSTYSWVTIDRDNPCLMCQFAYLKGIKNVESGSPVDIIPSLTSTQASGRANRGKPDSRWEVGRNNIDVGGNVKWGITPSLTLEAAINPDFSQVESDAGQIEVNQTFALAFPERRPFFQEGSDLFNTSQDVVYTRSINDPLAAAKLIGRFENSSFGWLAAADENTPLILPFEEESNEFALKKSYSNIFRYQHSLRDEMYIGGIVSDRRYEEGGSITEAGIDGIFRFMDLYRIEGQLLFGFTEEMDDPEFSENEYGDDYNSITFGKDGKYNRGFDGEKFWGTASYISLEREARHYSFDFDYWDTSPTYRSGNGFIRQADNKRYSFWNGYTFYWEDDFIERLTPNFNIGRIYNYSGLLKDEWYNFQVNANFKGQIFTRLSWFYNNENFHRIQFDDINRYQGAIEVNYFETIKGGISAKYGHFINRNSDDDDDNPSVKAKGFEFVELWLDTRPMEILTINGSLIFSNARKVSNGAKLYSGHIIRVRGNLQLTRELFGRLVVEYNDFRKQFVFEPLITYKLNPFSIFYVGAGNYYRNFRHTEDYRNVGWEQYSQQFFMKFQYLFSL
jgi:hypothetical protein